ncbi:3'(2'),5'-bisphosphate nucleotidase CysQ [Robertkochia marina]|uniref:3'(2'),5'-bisphosphate nucleotidase CysQ n=1 Tax=Robertkochia marina TaxID=1227945 RepID=A0A4S3M2N7_9FLAO|nr:3'(2'),5'-bisphosphate nucleotidase CysQ [Robertkochia marina]THD67745.1 3'(2'),5'-bisphosphate nucleotidase CysQ [Robertkochia marina]TRZ40958.1 3'(2'),5'-bisphosphate nucleotidase [Robertkochia marina]
MNNPLLRIAIDAAIAAGKEITLIYNTEYRVEEKEDQSPLTEADLASNKKIMEFLEKTPIPVISEENKEVAYKERKDWKQCWIVDPLDGTKEFIKRNGEFTVNIALIENNKPRLGVIYVPVTGELYYADVPDGRAWKTTLNGSETEFFEDEDIISPKPLNGLIRVVGSRSHMNQDTLDYLEEVKAEGKEVEIVSKGSSLKFCLVAEGRADVYPRFAPTMEWDTAAGQAICEAVGLKVIDQETQLPMVYNRENLLNNYFLVRMQ